MAGTIMQLYRAKNPKKSPLWQCASRHFDEFLDRYPEHYQPRQGPLRPIVEEVVHKFLDCGNLERGFARVRCDKCQHEYLLAFSCKTSKFCPSCHQKKVQATGAFIVDEVLAPVPHRHYVLALPRMLRPYFQHHRHLLRNLCTLGQECLRDFLRTALDLPAGLPAFVMTIPTFGEYLDFHPHLHILAADGLFDRDGQFHPLPPFPTRPLEELFQARILAFLVAQQLLPPARAQNLRSWKHTGFNVHAGDPVPAENRAELEKLAQYLLRNSFSVDKMTMEWPADTVIYRSRMNPKINRNFEVFTAPDFLAAITQHIPDRGAQNVRYFGWYSNKMRGQRHRRLDPLYQPTAALRTPPPPVRLPAKKWRDLILKVWHADPLRCPVCQSVMRIISVIDDPRITEKILRHLGVWAGPDASAARPPPGPAEGGWTYEPFGDVDPAPDYENALTD